MKQEMMKFLMAAKAIVYEPSHAEQLIPMLDTVAGAQTAVSNVIAFIEQKKQVPPQLLPVLKAQIFLLMVDMAREITGEKPDKNAIKQTLSVLVQ